MSRFVRREIDYTLDRIKYFDDTFTKEQWVAKLTEWAYCLGGILPHPQSRASRLIDLDSDEDEEDALSETA